MAEFNSLDEAYLKKEIEELTEDNINVKSDKIRFTTPIKYRGLEAHKVVLVTSGFSDKTRTQNYIGVTRAIYELEILLWS